MSPLQFSHSRHFSGNRFVELFEVFWSDGLPDHYRYFLDPLSSLHLNLQLQRDSSNHRKFGDINEALQISKQSTQTASVYLSAFRRHLINSEKISSEDCVEMAKAKLYYFIQSLITFELIERVGVCVDCLPI